MAGIVVLSNSILTTVEKRLAVIRASGNNHIESERRRPYVTSFEQPDWPLSLPAITQYM
jgi:hypothetical protein